MKKILLVVDYQNDFVDGTLGFPAAVSLDDGIAALVNEFSAAGEFIAYTMDTHEQDYLKTREGKALPVEHCIAITDGWKLYGKTAEALEAANALQVQKRSFGINPSVFALYGHTNNPFPDEDEVSEVHIVGVVTNICVVSNAVIFQAQYPEAQIVVHSGLCASFDPDLHNKTLDVLKGLQVKII